MNRTAYEYFYWIFKCPCWKWCLEYVIHLIYLNIIKIAQNFCMLVILILFNSMHILWWLLICSDFHGVFKCIPVRWLGTTFLYNIHVSRQISPDTLKMLWNEILLNKCNVTKLQKPSSCSCWFLYSCSTHVFPYISSPLSLHHSVADW